MTNYTFIKEALKTIRENKTRAEQTATANLDKMLKDAKYKELYYAEKIEKNNAGKLLAEGKKWNDEQLKTIKLNQVHILKNYNLTPNDLIPSYNCKKCNDTGIDENGDYCKCVKKQIGLIASQSCCLSSELETFSNSNFSIFDDSETTKKFYDKMQKWCNTDSKYKNIIVCGQVGVGKSYLLKCMLSELLAQGKYCIFASSFKLDEDFLKYHTTFNEEKTSFTSSYFECDYLFIDDLGTEPIFKNVTTEYLLNLVNQRLADGKATIISTNLTPNELLDRYGERIYSRLFNKSCSIVYQLNNKSDLRLKKHN